MAQWLRIPAVPGENPSWFPKLIMAYNILTLVLGSRCPGMQAAHITNVNKSSKSSKVDVRKHTLYSCYDD